MRRIGPAHPPSSPQDIKPYLPFNSLLKRGRGGPKLPQSHKSLESLSCLPYSFLSFKIKRNLLFRKALASSRTFAGGRAAAHGSGPGSLHFKRRRLLVTAAAEPPRRPRRPERGGDAEAASARARGLVPRPHDAGLSAGAPPDSAAQDPAGSARPARRLGQGVHAAAGAGEGAGECDAAAEPRARAGDGLHRMDRLRPDSRDAAALPQGGAASFSARGGSIRVRTSLLPIQPRMFGS